MGQLHVMSLNLCCWGYDDNTVDKRLERVKTLIDKYKPCTLGVQEATPEWMEYLSSNLEGYARVGEGREGGGKGEHTAIFYRTDRLNLIETDTFWLSETPRVVSKSWGSRCLRVLTWAKLRLVETGKEFVHVNTHIDFGELAPIMQTRMVLDNINSFDIPVICTGDFNFTEDHEGYKLLTSGKMADSKYLTSNTTNIATFHGYGEIDVSQEKPIDFCFVSKDDFIVNCYKVLDEKINGELYSDHHAVYVELDFKG